jgi:acyl-CoA thioesterase FadM
MDKARSSMFREHNIDIGNLFSEHFALVVVDAKLRYYRPILHNDQIHMYSRVVNFSEKSLTVEHYLANCNLSNVIFKAEIIDERLIVHKATITLVCADLIKHKSSALPAIFTPLLMDSWRKEF